MFPEKLCRTPKVFIHNGCEGDAASRTAQSWGEHISTSLWRIHALRWRRVPGRRATLPTWRARRLGGRRRRARVCTGSRLVLRVVTTQQARAPATRVAGLPTAPGSQPVHAHPPGRRLARRSKQPATPVSPARHTVHERPWPRAMVGVRPLPQRASLPPAVFPHPLGI